MEQDPKPPYQAPSTGDPSATESDGNPTSPLKWIFRGNIVVPTGNPFNSPEATSLSSSSSSVVDTADCLWLGPCLKLLLDHILTVDTLGFIRHLEPAEQYYLHQNCQSTTGSNPSTTTTTTTTTTTNIIQLNPDCDFLCPGFIDTHLHAPQFPYTGTATDLPLMGPDGWLESYAFPAERRLRDHEQARSVYNRVVATTLRHATTTAVYFATLDAAPCQALVDVCVGRGQRALVGKVCMDRNAPDDYCQSTQQNVDETVRVMEYIYQCAGKRRQARKGNGHDDDFSDDPSVPLPLVLPVITPRFIPTCTPELLSQLGQLAAAQQHHPCHITTHASESWDEVVFSRQCDVDDHHHGGRTDCEILDAHQLLTRHCLLAHAVHLTPSDRQLLRRRGSAIAHCPLSNFFFAGQCLPCRQLLSSLHEDQDSTTTTTIAVGLGTDVAGGYSPSMMHAARMAVVASHALQQQHYQPHDSNANSNTTSHVLDYRHAFYLATLGGATALRLQHRIGTLAVGMELDAFVWSVDDNVPWFRATDNIQDVFQKLCTLGDDRNVQRVFVQGREVYNNKQ